jgi:hypothetical protein
MQKLRWRELAEGSRGESMIYKNEVTCRSCGSDQLETILTFGETPLADRLLNR